MAMSRKQKTVAAVLLGLIAGAGFGAAVGIGLLPAYAGVVGAVLVALAVGFGVYRLKRSASAR